MSLLIRKAHVVTPGAEFDADILCRDGLVDSLDRPGRTRADGWDEVLDASGLVVLPGVIDPHVHSRDPGQTHKEDFAHSTRAAAAGGVTTILEMPNALPPVTSAEVLAHRVEQHSKVASVDFGLWGLALGAESTVDIRDLSKAGAVAIKLFWGFYFDRETGALIYDAKGLDEGNLRPPASTGDLWELFIAVAKAKLLLGLHAEDRGILEVLGRQHGDYDSYDTLLRTRPVAAESSAIASAIEIAMGTEARLHILHVSSARGIDLVRRAQSDLLRVSAETCPHYLTLTEADYESVGHGMKVYPPVRHEDDRKALWRAINDRIVTSVSSDHAPHSAAEREGVLSDLPAGGQGIQTMLPVLLNEVTKGTTSLQTLSWALSEGTARLYRLYPKKGSVLPGTDADFSIVDMDASWTIDQDRLLTKTKLSPWHNRSGRGRVAATVVRGNVIFRHGELSGSPIGQFVRPQ